ncbi:hypothetical protein HCU40_25685, partial [Pseudanabaena biceps]|nr:hypothetical protein [Pseudanabaena biceps]
MTGPNANKERWSFEYDAINQLTSAKANFDPSGGPWQGKIPGMEFGYSYDQIGNRLSTTQGGGSTGFYSSNYTPNKLNQYISRDVSGKLEVTGNAPNSPIVRVLDQQRESPARSPRPSGTCPPTGSSGVRVEFPNTAGPAAGQVAVESIPGSLSAYDIFLPKTPELFTYDPDGNLTSDGVWNYEWDAENRLSAMQLKTEIGAVVLNQSGSWLRLEFAYDYMGRRIRKQLLTSNTADQDKETGEYILEWGPSYDHRYVYDTPTSWNLSAVLADSDFNGTIDATIQTFAWGPDLSSTEQGAGGIGGLAVMLDDETDLGGGSGAVGPMFPTYDGNGNVMRVYSTNFVQTNQTEQVAEYRYGPFGEHRGQSGR